MAWKGVPKAALKIEFQNSTVRTQASECVEFETVLCCQASLLGTLSPWAGQVMLQSAGASHAEQELALPAWSVQLRLVHQSQTPNRPGWLPGEKALQGSELTESGSLQACGVSSFHLQSLGGRCPPGIRSAGWPSMRLFGTGIQGLWVLRGPSGVRLGN